MGEAKLRREAATRAGEAGRGTPASMPIPAGRKGLVISNPIEIDGTSLHARSSNLDIQELRAALLYWDEIVWPSSRMIHFASGPDEAYLEAQGVLKRPSYSFNGDAAQGMAMTQIMAFQELDAREPGKWSFAQGENTFLLRGGLVQQSNAALLELVRAIPVPDQDVPLNEILAFKERRNDELLLLRGQIDGLFAELDQTENTYAKLSENIKKIDAACADVLRLGREWQFPMCLTNFKTTYEFRPIATVAGAISGYVGAQGLGLPLSQAVLSGIGGSAIATAPALKLSFDGFKWKGLRPRLGPYRYVYQFHKELF